MSIPLKSLFSLLSVCQKFLESVEIWQSSAKNKFAQFFRDTVYIYQISKLIRSSLANYRNYIQRYRDDVT